MENFIVSARKYRPQTFDTVIGQKSITNTLKNAIRNKQLAQAFLFCGPRGVGKTTCARILAKTINCEHPLPSGDACDQCPSCISFNENASFNIYELDGASNNSVDDIRTLVDQVRIPPQMGIYKVYIIDEVHMLSASAFNAFLKTLEEPPPYAKFILATTEKHKIIPTILSRCQIFDFKRITVDDIANHLLHVASMENIVAEDNAVHVIAQKADGAMRDALSIFDQLVSFAGNKLTYQTVLDNLNVLDYEYYFKITNQILQGDIPGTLLTVNDIIDKGFDGQHFLIGFGEHLRNLMVCKDPATARLLETAPSIRNHYIEQAAQCSVGFLLKVLDISNRCDLNYKTSNNKHLHLELSLMQMCSLMMTNIQGPDAPSSKNINPQLPTPKTGHPSPQPIAPGQDATNRQGGPGARPPAPSTSGNPEATVKMKEIQKEFNSTLSIKNPAKKTQDTATISEASSQYTVPSPFSQSDLISVWDEFAEKLRNDFPHLCSTLRNSRPIILPEWQIEFTIDNKVLEDEFNQKKGELSEFLRSRLNNHKIQLFSKIAEIQKELKPYTDKEKYQKMAEKNPSLRTLREELDLEIDY